MHIESMADNFRNNFYQGCDINVTAQEIEPDVIHFA